MTSLFRRSRRLGVALAIAFGLTVFSAIAPPLFSDRVASLLPGPDVALADEPSSGGG